MKSAGLASGGTGFGSPGGFGGRRFSAIMRAITVATSVTVETRNGRRGSTPRSAHGGERKAEEVTAQVVIAARNTPEFPPAEGSTPKAAPQPMGAATIQRPKAPSARCP